MYMLHLLHQPGLDILGFERASGVGGTWYWNRYPGFRCDVESNKGRYLVKAAGCLYAANIPNFEGRDSFEGNTYQPGVWPADGVNLTAQPVGIISTGSSAIQSIPHIPAQAEHLTVFQRTELTNFCHNSRYITTFLLLKRLEITQKDRFG